MTAEDYAPLLIAFLSGFLQQWLGPKRILQLTTIPYIANFLMVALAPDNWVVVVCSRLLSYVPGCYRMFQVHDVVVCSRFMAGVAQGLLASNVYAADMSHKDYRQTLKMIEVRPQT